MKSIGLPPRPSLLIESLRSIGYTLDSALADIVDNSIAAGARKISIRFQWAMGHPWIAIWDDGRGMNKEQLIEAMRFGCTSPLDKRAEDDLGRFGLGMKTASISQCRKMTVVTWKNGKVASACWDLEHLTTHQGDDWQIRIHSKESINADPIISSILKQHVGIQTGTMVCWENLDGLFHGKIAAHDEQRFTKSMAAARKHLELVFHRFITPDPGHAAVKIDFNGDPLEAIDPFGAKHPARQELPSQPIKVNGDYMVVQPFILPHRSKIPAEEYEKFGGEDGYQQSQGFYLYRNKRLIVHGTWFKLIRKEALSKLVRVRIDIPNSMDSAWRIDVKKSHANPPESILQELRTIIGRIVASGHNVYTRKTTTLSNSSLIRVWNREIKDGKYTYSLNEEYPLIQELINDADKERAAKFKTCLKLISQAFPGDNFFSDTANDSLSTDKEKDSETHIEIARRLISSLKSLGLKDEELRNKLLAIELPPISESTLEKLIQ